MFFCSLISRFLTRLTTDIPVFVSENMDSEVGRSKLQWWQNPLYFVHEIQISKTSWFEGHREKWLPRDVGSFQRCCRRFKSSAVWCGVDWLIPTCRRGEVSQFSRWNIPTRWRFSQTFGNYQPTLCDIFKDSNLEAGCCLALHLCGHTDTYCLFGRDVGSCLPN